MSRHFPAILSAFAIGLALATSGCTTVPPIDFTVQDVGVISNRKAAQMMSLTVGYASHRQQGVIQGNAQIPPVWKEGLQDAINRSLAFRDDSSTKVNLSVRITTLDVPEFGASMKTRAAAIYEIVDRSNGDILFSEKIESEGIVPANYAFYGLVRASESVNRAVRNNIAGFIQRLNEANLSKPLFRGDATASR